MKNIHGTFKSFAEMGKAMGVKAPQVKPKVLKCPNCGGPLNRVGESNVWTCDFFRLSDDKLPDGTAIQVFEKCNNLVIDKV